MSMIGMHSGNITDRRRRPFHELHGDELQNDVEGEGESEEDESLRGISGAEDESETESQSSHHSSSTISTKSGRHSAVLEVVK